MMLEDLIEGLAALFDKSVPEEVSRAAAKHTVESVLSAVARGEVTLPNEVGRGDFVWGNLGVAPSWDKPPTKPLNRQEPYHRFIALGKEDEK